MREHGGRIRVSQGGVDADDDEDEDEDDEEEGEERV